MRRVKMLICISLLFLCLLASGNRDAQAEIMVYDVQGNLLGVFLGNSSNNTVQIYFPSIDRFMHLNVNTGDIIGRDIYFESSDCSGIPFVVGEAAYKIIKNGNNYYTGEKRAPIVIQANSALRSHNSSCEVLHANIMVVPLQDVNLSIPLPVALPLSFEVQPQKHFKKKQKTHKKD